MDISNTTFYSTLKKLGLLDKYNVYYNTINQSLNGEVDSQNYIACNTENGLVTVKNINNLFTLSEQEVVKDLNLEKYDDVNGFIHRLMDTKFLIIDTETTSLGNGRQPVQVSSILCDYDFNIIDVNNFYIKDHFGLMTSKSLEIHRLTNDFLNKNSSEPEDVLNYYNDILEDNENVIVIGHNISFDIVTLNNLAGANGYDDLSLNNSFCTLNKRSQILEGFQKRNLPQPESNKLVDYSNLLEHEKLTDLVNNLFNVGNFTHHDARTDVTIVYSILKLIAKGVQ